MVYDTFIPVMSILALVLLLTSAFLHALWNLLLKQSQEKYLAMGWQVIISAIISIFALFFTGLPPRTYVDFRADQHHPGSHLFCIY